MSDVSGVEDLGFEEDTEAEAKAREMGWRPVEEWEGDTDGWMDAETFIERQDRRRAVANEEFKNENAKLKAEMAELKQTIDEFKGWRDKTEERAYKRALKEIQAKQRQAVEDGDTEAYDEAAAEAAELQKDMDDMPAAKPSDNPDDIPAYTEWHKKNDWYNSDLRLTKMANDIAPEVARVYKLTPDQPEFYEKITEAVKAEYPDKFKNPRRASGSGVEGGSAPTGGKGGGRLASKLPASVKATGERFVRQGLFKNIEEYAKDYFAEGEDNE